MEVFGRNLFSFASNKFDVWMVIRDIAADGYLLGPMLYELQGRVEERGGVDSV